MIWMLRNIGVHLWISILFTIPAVFLLLVFLGPVFPGLNPVATSVAVFILVFAGFGSLMDVLARKLVNRLVKEGQTWERSGVVSKARKAYERAIRIYDTFLFWPFFNRQTAARICGAIARSHIHETSKHPGFNLASTVYLKLHPDDEDVVLPWLTRLAEKDSISGLEQEVLTDLARRYVNRPVINTRLADIFLRLERKDFDAKKLYQHVNGAAAAPSEMSKRLDSMMSTAGEPDEPLQKAGPHIPSPIKVRKNVRLAEVMQKATALFTAAARKTMAGAGAALSILVLSLNRFLSWIKESQKARLYMKAVFLSVVFIWLGVFMINTISHMFKSRAVQKGEDKQLEVQVPKPFTIQVAAYLKQTHADRYVAVLKKKGIDASVKKAAGGGKTWYLVRVSEFVDKQSAAAYGTKLKQQKIIDDFFVNNK